jgi:stage II sporulation protein D
MKNITCRLRLFSLLSALSIGFLASVSALANPSYNHRLNQVRYMPEEPIMKVLLTKDQESIMVEVRGPHNVYDPYTGKKLEAAFMGSSYYMNPTTDGIKWGQEFPGVYQIVIIPDEPSDGIFVNGISYPGAVAFYEVDNRLAAVNWASLDDFTSALVSSNFLPKETDQKEAIAAYAIALRTQAYQQILSSEHQFWDVSAENCGYRGNVAVRLDIPFREAIKATKKIVMAGNEQSNIPMDFTKKAVDDLRQKMPISEVQAMARTGKDAKIILHRFYPDQNLTVADSSCCS